MSSTESAAASPVEPLQRSLWRRSWPYLRVAVGFAALGVAIWAVSGKTHELRSLEQYLGQLRWWWMVVAVIAEVACYGAQSSLQRRLLRSGGVEIQAAPMLGITTAGSAIQYTFPGGYVFYLAYLYRQFRRRGADDVLSAWVLIAFNLVLFVALTALAALGLALAFGNGSSFDLVESIFGVLILAVLFALAVTERRRLVPYAAWLVGASQRLFHRPRYGTAPHDVVLGWSEELKTVSPSQEVWIRAAVMGMATWIADLSCLAVSFYAVGVGVPWRGLLLAYGAGQLASLLPITPGGLGAVEGSITVALVTFGRGGTSTVAAVLLYRSVSFWLVLLAGWVAWACLAMAGRSVKDLTVTPAAGQPAGPTPGTTE